MPCTQCEVSRQQNLESCAHCGKTLVPLPELTPPKQLLAAGKGAQAAPLLADIAKQHPRLAECQALLGAALIAAGRTQEAVSHFEEAVRLAVASAPYRYNLALAYRAVGRTEDARQQLQYALQVDPAYEKARTALATLPGGAGPATTGPQQPGAMRTLDDSPQTTPTTPQSPAPTQAQPAGMRSLDGEVERAGQMRTLGEQPAAGMHPLAAEPQTEMRALGAQPEAGMRTSRAQAGEADPAARAAPPGRKPEQVEEVPSYGQGKLGPAAGVAAGVGLVGGLVVLGAFRMLTSPDLVAAGPDFVTFGGKGALLVALMAGLTAACFNVPGLPKAGALGGLVAGAIGFMAGAMATAAKPSLQVVLGAALAGVIIGALAELIGRSEQLQGKRAIIISVLVLAGAGFAIKQWINLGVVVGKVYYCPYSEVDTGVRLALPEAEVVVWSKDGNTALYRTHSIRAEGRVPGAGTLAGDNALYVIRNIPKGSYLITATHPHTKEVSEKAGLTVNKGRLEDAIKRDLFITQKYEPPPARINPIPIPEDIRSRMPQEFVPPSQRDSGSTLVPTQGGGPSIRVPTRAPSSVDEGDWE